MKKLILLILTIALALNTTHAQTKKENSLLWEISGNGLKSSSYLFGTYHLAGKSFADSLGYIKTHFNECKAVAGEMILDSAMVGKVSMAMLLTDGTTLDKVFNTDDYKLVADYATASTGMDMRMLNHFKPSAIYMLATMLNAPKSISDTNPALDMYFQQEAKRLNYKVLGLETIEDQIDMMFNFPMDLQKKQLLNSIRKKDKEKLVGQQLYNLYLQQDFDGLEKLMTDENDLPEITDKMLKNRNLKWMTELPPILKEQPTFIAVGAAHLVGQYGLVNQLRLKGYMVKAVKM